MTIVGLFASIGEHIPILKKEKLGEPDPEGHIKAAHYRGTTLLILGCCLLVTCTEWVSGTDSIIDCVHEGAIPENVINTYCYIMGTFSVPRHYVDYDTQIGKVYYRHHLHNVWYGLIRAKRVTFNFWKIPVILPFFLIFLQTSMSFQHLFLIFVKAQKNCFQVKITLIYLVNLSTIILCLNKNQKKMLK